MMFHSLNDTEISSLQKHVDPLIAMCSTRGKQVRSTDEENEMDKYRQSFAMEETGAYRKPGGDDQILVQANTVLEYVKGALEQDCKSLSELPRGCLTAVDVSSTHDTHHESNGTAKYELTIRGSAWYVFKPEDYKSATSSEPWRIVEVKAGCSILTKGECYKWEYFLLRPDLGRPGPTELAMQSSIKRVTSTITYGDVAQKVVSTPQDTPKDKRVEPGTPQHSEPPKTKSRKNKRSKSTKGLDTWVSTAGGTVGDNFWLEDTPNGKQHGPFQATHWIQARKTESTKIYPDTTCRYQDSNLQQTVEVHITAVGRWLPVGGGTQRVVISRMRPLGNSTHELRAGHGWDSLKVTPATNVHTRTCGLAHTHTTTQTYTTHTRHTDTRACARTNTVSHTHVFDPS